MMFWFNFGLMSLSCAAAAITLYCWYHVRKLLRGVSMRSLGQLSTEVAELQSAYESLLTSHRRLLARINMREVRERQKLEPLPEQPAVVEATDREKLRALARSRGHRVG